MCAYTGRAKEKIKIPSKPISEGFKRWVIADDGYFLSWAWHVKEKGPLCLRYKDLNPTQSVVAYLVDQLPSPGGCRYHLWLDNLFNSTSLCTYFYNRGIGCSGTARTNSGVHQGLIDIKNKAAKLGVTWGQLFNRVDTTGHVCSIGWMDHGLVLFLTNAEDPFPQVLRVRKKPSKTSTFANVTRAPFGRDESIKELSIPVVVDRYNHRMNGVDRGDQLRAQATLPRTYKAWKALFFDSIQLVLCNSYLLAAKAPGSSSRSAIDYLSFRREVSAALIRRGGDWGQGNQHPRLDFSHSNNSIVPMHQLRHNDLHKQVRMSQRVCAACRCNKKRIKRGLDSGRVPLGELDSNLIPKVSRSKWGCKACGVNICFKGPCWQIYHAGFKDK